LNIPNAITILRFILVPIYLAVFFTEGRGVAAGTVFLICGISDVLDGYIARKYNMITKIGQALDPLADKFMLIAVVITLWLGKIISIWIVGAYILKELIMILGGTLLMKKDNKVLPARWYGKVSTALFFALTVFVLYAKAIDFSVESNYLIINICFGVSFAFSVFGFINYLFLYLKIRKD